MPQFRHSGGIALISGLQGNPPQYTTFRYHRIYFTGATDDGSVASIAEIQFRTTIGGAISNPPGTGGAIGGDFDSGIVGYAKAFTGSGADYWAKSGSSWNNLAWVGWDYGSGNSISCVQVYIMAPPGGLANRAPKDFKYQVSNDGSNWTDKIVKTGEPSWSSNEVRLYNV